MRYLAVIALTGCASAGPELFTNRDFEDLDASGWITSWRRVDSNPEGDIKVVPSGNGGWAVQWQMNNVDGGGWEYWIDQDLPASAVHTGGLFEISGMYYADQLGDIALNYVVSGEPSTDPWVSSIEEAAQFPTVANEWAPFRFLVQIPSGDGSPIDHWRVSLHSIKFTTTPVRLTLDNVSMREVL